MNLSRLGRLLWISAIVLLVAALLVPVSTRLSRAGALGLFLVVWVGLIAVCWHRWVLRIALLGGTLLVAAFLALPARAPANPESLRTEYLTGLRRYEGVRYFWGGESPLGIDCSGLIRRGLIDTLFWQGLRTLDAGPVRRALSLWWNDCTAEALGTGHAGLTAHVVNTPSLNKLDHTTLLPGDLAVTASGIHILAYLGNREWIEADPGVGKVITVTAPSRENLWFDSPMKIVRWKLLEAAAGSNR